MHNYSGKNGCLVNKIEVKVSEKSFRTCSKRHLELSLWSNVNYNNSVLRRVFFPYPWLHLLPSFYSLALWHPPFWSTWCEIGKTIQVILPHRKLTPFWGTVNYLQRNENRGVNITWWWIFVRKDRNTFNRPCQTQFVLHIYISYGKGNRALQLLPWQD